MRQFIEGSHAVAEAVRLCRVQVIAAYPITPQTHISERLAELTANHTLPARFIMVESEHSAMACCIGAASTGVRVFTATSSHGLALMHEMLHWASGARLPIVMTNVNRALGPPWNLWADQTDSTVPAQFAPGNRNLASRRIRSSVERNPNVNELVDSLRAKASTRNGTSHRRKRE